MRPAKLALLLALNLGFLAGTALCQNQARSVQGSVTYQGGEIAPEATVQIEDVSSKQVESCVADHNGHYHFPALKMDREYTLRATKNGHWSDVHRLSKFSGKVLETVNLHLKLEPDER